MIATVIVDDEELARDELAFLLKSIPDLDLVGSASNGLEAVSLIEKLEPDLVFLDVQMPGLDGMGVVRRLRESGAALPHFIFATAFDQYAIEAFRLEAMDYLLKPIDRERLEESVERARRAIAEPAEPVESVHRTKLLIRKDSRNFVVDAQDVVYATIDNGSISVVSTALEGQSNYRTLEDLQANLDREIFWRVHRSYLVNINRIREVVPWFKSSFQLRMDDRKQTEIPVSRVQTKRLRELLKL